MTASRTSASTESAETSRSKAACAPASSKASRASLRRWTSVPTLPLASAWPSRAAVGSAVAASRAASAAESPRSWYMRMSRTRASSSSE